MNTVQLKLERAYHDKIQEHCRRFGVSKADLVRFMLDTMENWGVQDDEFNRWYDGRTYNKTA